MTQADLLRVLAALTLLTSCASRASTDEMEAAIITMRASPAAREEFIGHCNQGKFTADQRASLAVVMRVPESEVLPVFCRRVTHGLIDGRITAQQYLDIGTGKSTSAIMRAIIPTEANPK